MDVNDALPSKYKTFDQISNSKISEIFFKKICEKQGIGSCKEGVRSWKVKKKKNLEKINLKDIKMSLIL